MVSSNGNSTRPWRIVASAWIVFAALLLVFGKDVNTWAQAADMPGQQSVAQAAQAVENLAGLLGIISARDTAQATAKSVYGWPVTFASVGVPTAPVDVPQVAAALAPPTATPVPAVNAQTPPVKVLIVGDSFIEAQIGAKLEDILVSKYGITVKRYGLRSTGLARLDYYDWTKKIRELKSDFTPDLVIGNWGANDCQGITDASGTVLSKFGTDKWDAVYADRVKALVGVMGEGGAKVVIFGLPAMRNLDLNNRVKRLNGVTEKATQSANGTFIPVWDMTIGKDGKYLSKVSMGGQDKLMRMADGVHFSGPGAEYVALKLIDVLKQDFGLKALK